LQPRGPYADIVDGHAVDADAHPFLGCHRVGADGRLPVDAVIFVVIGVSGIENDGGAGGIEVAGAKAGDVAADLLGFAGDADAGAEDHPVDRGRGDLAVLDVAQSNTRIRVVAAPRHRAATEIHHGRKRWGRDRGRGDGREVLEHESVDVGRGSRVDLAQRAGRTGVTHDADFRRPVGGAPARLRRHRADHLDILRVDRVGGEPRCVRLADAGGREPADLHAQRWLRGRFARDIGNRDGAAEQVERHLAVARFVARGADLREDGLDLGGDPLLHVEFEAEKGAGRDDNGGQEADQDLYHAGELRWPIVRRAKCHIVG
jgi:hypothetical protein